LLEKIIEQIQQEEGCGEPGDEDDQQENDLVLQQALSQYNKDAERDRKSDEGSSGAEIEDKAFQQYGTGILNFFKLIQHLTWLMFVLSGCAIVQMGLLKSFGGLEYLEDQKVSFSALHSLGNIGFATTVCSRSVMNWSDNEISLNFQCQGTTQITQILSSGLLYDKILPRGTDDNSLRVCSMNASQVASSPFMPFFKKSVFEQMLLAECKGRQQCHFRIRSGMLTNMPDELKYENLIVYAQVGCLKSEEGIETSNLRGLAITCIGVWMAFYFAANMHYRLVNDTIWEKLIDANLITASDYTIKIKIPKSMFHDFTESLAGEATQNQSVLQRFRMDLCRRI